MNAALDKCRHRHRYVIIFCRFTVIVNAVSAVVVVVVFYIIIVVVVVIVVLWTSRA